MTSSVPGMWPSDVSILGDGPSTPRLRAISIVLAAYAGLQPPVVKWRMEYLGGKLLPADQIDTWIKARPESTRPPAVWLSNIPLERLAKVEDGSYAIPRDVMKEAKRTTRDLFYATPEQERAREKVRAVGGVLDTLRGVAIAMVDFHSALWGINTWKEEQAVTYILTGYAPLVPEDSFPLPERSGRRQTDKHLQLAAFAAQQDVVGRVPAERLVDWNMRFPLWAYKNTTNFGWDSREALRRLMQGRDDRVEGFDLDTWYAPEITEELLQQAMQPSAYTASTFSPPPSEAPSIEGAMNKEPYDDPEEWDKIIEQRLREAEKNLAESLRRQNPRTRRTSNGFDQGA